MPGAAAGTVAGTAKPPEAVAGATPMTGPSVAFHRIVTGAMGVTEEPCTCTLEPAQANPSPALAGDASPSGSTELMLGEALHAHAQLLAVIDTITAAAAAAPARRLVIGPLPAVGTRVERMRLLPHHLTSLAGGHPKSSEEF